MKSKLQEHADALRVLQEQLNKAEVNLTQAKLELAEATHELHKSESALEILQDNHQKILAKMLVHKSAIQEIIQ